MNLNNKCMCNIYAKHIWLINAHIYIFNIILPIYAQTYLTCLTNIFSLPVIYGKCYKGHKYKPYMPSICHFFHGKCRPTRKPQRIRNQTHEKIFKAFFKKKILYIISLSWHGHVLNKHSCIVRSMYRREDII